MMTPVNPEGLMNNEIETPRLDRSSSTSSMDSWVTDVRLNSPIEKVVCGGFPSSSRPKSASNLRGSTSSSPFFFPPQSQKTKDEPDSPIHPPIRPFSRRDPNIGRPSVAVRTMRPTNQQSSAASVSVYDKNPAATLQMGMRTENTPSQRLFLAMAKPTGRPSVQMQSPLQDEGAHWSTKGVNRNSTNLPPPRSRSRQVLNGSDPTQVDQAERVKTKLLSVWNNMKYGWTVRRKVNFSCRQPIWLLGCCYHEIDKRTHGTEENGSEHGSPVNSSSMEGFKLDFMSRIWLTYRREFPALTGSSLTTDCGWGCMLRSGQMMLAHALVCHFLGRSWRILNKVQTDTTDTLHRMIIRWFGDDPSSICPFSLHRLVATGEDFGKKAGDWYGPASVAFILKQALGKASEENPMLDKVCIYIAQDCTVYKSDVIEMATAPPRVRKIVDQGRRPSPRTEVTSPLLSRTWSNPQLAAAKSEDTKEMRSWRGVVVLVPVRLGGDRLNPIYIPCIRALLSHESCIGIIGGRPKHSLFFVGFQEDNLIHLDPHYCQETVDVLPADFPVDSFHCSIQRKIQISKMDPSCSIGFYFRTREDFDTFTDLIAPALIPPHQKSDYPIFVISPGSSLEASSSLPQEDYVTADGGSSDYESEDFVLL